jgi:hypothetical protein
MTKEINQVEYNNTLTGGMTDVTQTAEPVVDVWPYVELLSKEGIVSNYVLENSLVEKVYRSKDSKYDHVLLPTAKENNFLVLVIDIEAKAIMGHHQLDLNKLYK